MGDTVKLQAGDDVILTVEKTVALTSQTVKGMLEDLGLEGDVVVPLPNVTGAVLTKVMEFAKHHHDNPQPEEEKDEEAEKKERVLEFLPWDKEFIDAVDQDMLFGLMLAANYLDMKPLLDLTAKTVAVQIKDLDAEGIRKKFGLERAFTDEQEKELREQIEKIE